LLPVTPGDLPEGVEGMEGVGSGVDGRVLDVGFGLVEGVEGEYAGIVRNLPVGLSHTQLRAALVAGLFPRLPWLLD
jgi:hypothetical protein